MAQIDQQTQTKTISGIVTLISTRTIIHTSSANWNLSPSAFDILGVPLRRTITSSHVAEVRQTEETSVSDSHWPITSNHWALTSQSKDHSYWTPIAFYTTILSVNSTNHATIWDYLPTASCQVCGCVSNASLGTSIPSGKDCCENEKRENATTWTINKSGDPTVVATTDTSHKWKNSSALSTSMTDRVKTVPLTLSERSSVADVSRIPQLLLIKNQADTIRVRRYGFGTEGFLFLVDQPYFPFNPSTNLFTSLSLVIKV